MKYFVRTERSVADHDVPGLPHSVVKYAQSTSVRELIQKIEDHPDRHVLQQDLRQINHLILFSPVGNIELFELLETDPKRSAQLFIILEYRYTVLHVRAFLA